MKEPFIHPKGTIQRFSGQQHIVEHLIIAADGYWVQTRWHDKLNKTLQQNFPETVIGMSITTLSSFLDRRGILCTNIGISVRCTLQMWNMFQNLSEALSINILWFSPLPILHFFEVSCDGSGWNLGWLCGKFSKTFSIYWKMRTSQVFSSIHA